MEATKVATNAAPDLLVICGSLVAERDSVA
jgi:hypothetical protein